MPTQIRLSRQQITDLAAIRDLGAEALQGVLAHLQRLKPIPLRPTALRKEVVCALGGNESAADHLLRPVLGLNQLIRQRELTVDEVFEGLRQGILSADPSWSDTEVDGWNAVEPPLRHLFESTPLRTVSKAIDLAYEYANLFQGARIITDIRPVFNDLDDDKMDMEGAVVSFTLRLLYDSREGNHSLSIALDKADVETLRYQCGRALSKARFARKRMRDTGVPTVISGESTDESD